MHAELAMSSALLAAAWFCSQAFQPGGPVVNRVADAAGARDG